VVTHVEGNNIIRLFQPWPADESNIFLQRLRLILQQRQLSDAMQVLNDETHDGGLAAANTLLALDVFRDHLNTAVVDLQDAGNDEQQIFRDLRRLAIRALRDTRDLLQERSSSAWRMTTVSRSVASAWWSLWMVDRSV